MSDEYTQQRSISPEPTNPLQNRPRRRSRRGPAALLLFLGGVIIVGVVAIVAWQALSPHAPSPSSSAPGKNIATKDTANGNAFPPGWNDPSPYWQAIRTQVAQGLHLSVAQISVRLQAAGIATTATPVSTNKKSTAPDPGAPMANLAAQQGISTDQLRTLELNALQTACNAMVTQGKLTQADANQRIQMFRNWDQGTMNWYVMHAFTG